jgi:hypothetical protein
MWGRGPALYKTQLLIYNRKCFYLNFGNSTPPQLTSVQWSFFRLRQLENEEMEAFC